MEGRQMLFTTKASGLITCCFILLVECSRGSASNPEVYIVEPITAVAVLSIPEGFGPIKGYYDVSYIGTAAPYFGRAFRHRYAVTGTLGKEAGKITLSDGNRHCGDWTILRLNNGAVRIASQREPESYFVMTVGTTKLADQIRKRLFDIGGGLRRMKPQRALPVLQHRFDDLLPKCY